MKNKKIKKYFSGATIKGGLTTGIDKLGDSGAVAGMAGGLLIDSLAKKQDPKYTNQLKDGDQNTGRAIGNGLGQGLNLLVPGLGSVAAPILGAAGAAIQRGFQGDKLDAIKKATDAKEANDKFNDTVDGVDSTTTMKKQFKDGGKVKVSKKEIAAESTSTPKVLAPKLITSTDDIKDTLTGKFLKKKIMTGSDTDEVSDQQDRSILREHVLNGNPKIRVKGPNQRSNYFMAKNEMHLSEFNDYPAELAHSKQTKDKGADYVTNKNRAERTKYGDMPRYSIKGTIENEAHDTKIGRAHV